MRRKTIILKKNLRRGDVSVAQEGSSRSSIRVARIGGIDVRMHWTFVVLVLLVVWVNISSGVSTVGVGLLWITAVFVSVLVHEYAHCVVARRRGAVVEDILLLPIGGLSQLKEMPERPADEFAIAIVGPLTSLGLRPSPRWAVWSSAPTCGHQRCLLAPWFARLAWLNVLLGGFNLLPALPMDGGRVARALLERHHDRAIATHQAARIARVLAAVMIVGGVFYDLWLVLIGVFVYLGASAEEQAAENERARSAESEDPDPAPTFDGVITMAHAERLSGRRGGLAISPLTARRRAVGPQIRRASASTTSGGRAVSTSVADGHGASTRAMARPISTVASEGPVPCWSRSGDASFGDIGRGGAVQLGQISRRLDCERLSQAPVRRVDPRRVEDHRLAEAQVLPGSTDQLVDRRRVSGEACSAPDGTSSSWHDRQWR